MLLTPHSSASASVSVSVSASASVSASVTISTVLSLCQQPFSFSQLISEEIVNDDTLKTCDDWLK